MNPATNDDAPARSALPKVEDWDNLAATGGEKLDAWDPPQPLSPRTIWDALQAAAPSAAEELRRRTLMAWSAREVAQADEMREGARALVANRELFGDAFAALACDNTLDLVQRVTASDAWARVCKCGQQETDPYLVYAYESTEATTGVPGSFRTVRMPSLPERADGVTMCTWVGDRSVVPLHPHSMNIHRPNGADAARADAALAARDAECARARARMEAVMRAL
jgi:hypothetical protein